MGTAAVTEERKAIFVRLDRKAYDKIVASAKRNHRTHGAEVAFRLEEQLRKEKASS